MSTKRNLILVNKSFQFRFAFFVCSWLFALSLAYPLVIYNLFGFFSSLSQNELSAESIEKLSWIKGEVIFLLFAFQVVFLGTTFVISVILSHRIAGPVYKLNLFLKKFGKSNSKDRLVFRKGDHFREIAESYNEMLDSCEKKSNDRIVKVSNAIGLLENLREKNPDDRNQIDSVLGDLRNYKESF